MNRLTLEEHELAYGLLPEDLDGVRILQVSDLHLSRGSRGREGAVSRALGTLTPDLVLLTGDFVNHARYWDRLGGWLADVLPEVPRFAVPGNWDYKNDERLERMGRTLSGVGIDVLVNQSRWVPRGDSGIRVVGIDDVRCGALDLTRAFGEVNPGEFVVVACHSPDILLHLDARKFAFLASGHTHGGQVRIPGFGALFTSTKLGRRFDAGLYRLHAHGYAYVSRGVGGGHVPLRICCPPELALFRLRRILKHSD